VARVSPIYKESDKKERGNYRPISVLSTVAKLFEKLVCIQLTDYLNENDILSPCQSGFRQSQSTMSSLLSNSDSWLVNMDAGHGRTGKKLARPFRIVPSLSKKIFRRNFPKLLSTREGGGAGRSDYEKFLLDNIFPTKLTEFPTKLTEYVPFAQQTGGGGLPPLRHPPARYAHDAGLVNGVVFLDLRKAFDTVDHEILISPSKWFISY
jgi:hypothetical protein